MSFHIYDHEAGNLLSPGTAPLSFESQQDAEQHLRRLDRGDLASGRYEIIGIGIPGKGCDNPNCPNC